MAAIRRHAAGAGARAARPCTPSDSTTPPTSPRWAVTRRRRRSCSSRSAGRWRRPAARSAVPEVVRRLDYEGELVIVIGAGGRIAGYCIADDVSARDLQGREPQWTRAKGADTFCPFGPWITTADEVPDPGDLRLAHVGQRRAAPGLAAPPTSCSAATTLVEFIAQTCTLRPGDLILTGTPSGVGMALDPPQFLQSGDVIRIEIDDPGSYRASRLGNSGLREQGRRDHAATASRARSTT